MIGASLAVLASQNTLYAVRLALRFRVWLGTARAWLPRVFLLFFLAAVGAKSVLSIIPSSPRISTSFCHTWGTRKVQPKEPCPNRVSEASRAPPRTERGPILWPISLAPMAQHLAVQTLLQKRGGQRKRKI